MSLFDAVISHHRSSRVRKRLSSKLRLCRSPSGRASSKNGALRSQPASALTVLHYSHGKVGRSPPDSEGDEIPFGISCLQCCQSLHRRRFRPCQIREWGRTGRVVVAYRRNVIAHGRRFAALCSALCTHCAVLQRPGPLRGSSTESTFSVRGPVVHHDGLVEVATQGSSQPIKRPFAK